MAIDADEMVRGLIPQIEEQITKRVLAVRRQPRSRHAIQRITAEDDAREAAAEVGR